MVDRFTPKLCVLYQVHGVSQPERARGKISIVRDVLSSMGSFQNVMGENTTNLCLLPQPKKIVTLRGTSDKAPSIFYVIRMSQLQHVKEQRTEYEC